MHCQYWAYAYLLCWQHWYQNMAVLWPNARLHRGRDWPNAFWKLGLYWKPLSNQSCLYFTNAIPVPNQVYLPCIANTGPMLTFSVARLWPPLGPMHVCTVVEIGLMYFGNWDNAGCQYLTNFAIISNMEPMFPQFCFTNIHPALPILDQRQFLQYCLITPNVGTIIWPIIGPIHVCTVI